MDKKIALVLKGFIGLTESQQKELLREITRYQEGNFTVRKDLNESIRTSINFGPAPGGACPCCGK